MYLLIALLFYFREYKKFISVLLTVVMVLLYVVYNFFIERVAGLQLLHLQGYHFLNLGTFFVMGSLLASIQFKKKVSVVILFISVVTLLLALYFEIYSTVKYIVLPVVVLSLEFIPLCFFSTFGKYGDLSYRIYIYSFPV